MLCPAANVVVTALEQPEEGVRVDRRTEGAIEPVVWRDRFRHLETPLLRSGLSGLIVMLGGVPGKPRAPADKPLAAAPQNGRETRKEVTDR